MATGGDAAGPAIDPRDLGATGAQKPASASAEHSESGGEEEQQPGEMSESDLDLQILINCQLAAKHASAAAAAALQRYLIRREGGEQKGPRGKQERKFFMQRAREMVHPTDR